MQDNDFKYVLDDLYHTSLGARYSYEEVIDNIEISYKFRQICRQYFEKEVAPETTIESHLYYLRPEDQSSDIYRRLKTKVLCLLPDRKGKKMEDGSYPYMESVMSIQELTALSPAKKQSMGIIIREITISKVGLMTLVL